MKINHVIGILLALCVVLALNGCGSDPQEVTKLTTEPVSSTTEAATMPEVDQEVAAEDLSDFLDQWLENYESREPNARIGITGLCTPVVLELEGDMVRQLSAWDRTLEVNAGVVEGYIEFSMTQWQDTLVVNGEDNSWLITEAETFAFPAAESVNTCLCVEDGLRYCKSADALNYLDQWVTMPLNSTTDRGNLYSEEGTVTFENGQPVLTMTSRTLMGDVYDFDALFVTVKAMGWADYEDCETVDDLFRRNKETCDPWLTYPWEPKEPAQKAELAGLTLELPHVFTEEERSESLLVLRGTGYAYEDLVLRVTTGTVTEGYPGLEAPLTDPLQMLQQDRTSRDAVSSAEAQCVFKGVNCLIFEDGSDGLARGYYLEGDRWWVIEAANIYAEQILTYVACGKVV